MADGRHHDGATNGGGASAQSRATFDAVPDALRRRRAVRRLRGARSLSTLDSQRRAAQLRHSELPVHRRTGRRVPSVVDGCPSSGHARTSNYPPHHILQSHHLLSGARTQHPASGKLCVEMGILH